MARLSEVFKVGGLTVAALSDGAPDWPLGGFFYEVNPADWTAALEITDAETPVPFNFGTFLIQGDGRTTLIDTGVGVPVREMRIAGGGELLLRLEELGVGRDEVETIVQTHLHADHCGWNTDDDADGAITFPNATVYVARAELEHWNGLALDGDDRARVARRQTSPYVNAGRLEPTDGEFAVSESLTMVPTPGHTPGHCSVLLASGGEHLVILGDAAHHPVHLEHHDWIPEVDLDRAESTRSRGKIAALAVEKDALVTGGHFPILTLGRVREVEGGYRWEGV